MMPRYPARETRSTMSIHKQALAKIRQLPESLAQEVNNLIDFLVFKQDEGRMRMLSQLNEAQELAESDIGDYARGLADYEDQLTRGEISW